MDNPEYNELSTAYTLDLLAECFHPHPGVSDLDAVREWGGQVISFEFKTGKKPIPEGQRRMFDTLVRLPGWTMVVIRHPDLRGGIRIDPDICWGYAVHQEKTLHIPHGRLRWLCEAWQAHASNNDGGEWDYIWRTMAEEGYEWD